MPGPAMRTEQRIERGKLEPSRVKLSRQFRRGIKSARIRPPKRRQTQRSVDAHRHLRGERRPARINVAGPDPAAVTRRARISIAVQTPRAFARPYLQGA